ncbi:MAG: YdcF family protein [Deltaproteobacteria bacterium]|nr:YdcF family protein [Deltaproteobacteria bacterium]
MFVLKKIVTLLLMPMSLCLGVLAVGILLLWMRRRIRAAKIVLTFGFLVLTALSFSAVADPLTKHFELWYPPLLDTSGMKDVKWVVVLGGGHASSPTLPPNAQIGNSSLARLIEGIRIHRELPESKLVLSGGAVFDSVPEATTMAAVARMLDVTLDDMVLESQSKDTGQQAQFVQGVVQSDRCILVTSAIHMPRAMRVFEQKGLRPIPAPTDFGDWMRKENSPYRFFPRAGELRKVEAAFHEFLGLLWARMTG